MSQTSSRKRRMTIRVRKRDKSTDSHDQKRSLDREERSTPEVIMDSIFGGSQAGKKQ